MGTTPSQEAGRDALAEQESETRPVLLGRGAGDVASDFALAQLQKWD